MTHPGEQQWERYERQIRLDGLGPKGQEALSNGKVTIVGLGGLGSWVAALLVRAGVGAIRLVDDDQVETVNLHRQALYTEADARTGRKKVSAAAERLSQINPEVYLEPVVARVTESTIEEFCGDRDLLVDGTDDFTVRFLLNDYAVQAGIPWVFAGVLRAEGQVMAIRPGKGPCLRCLLPSPPRESQKCSDTGVLGPAVTVVAAWEAAEALKVLVGESGPTMLLQFDVWTNTVRSIPVSRSERCPCCGSRQFDYYPPGT